MTTRVLNRDFHHPADGMYMIEPLGGHPNAAGGCIQQIDKIAAASIVNRFNSQAADTNFPGMLIDHEHFKHDETKETTAYGWLMKLEARDDGIYGKIRWTKTGQAAVDGGDYRFFSTEYDPADVQVLEQGPPKVVSPIRLSGVTLTNMPNNKGGLPITNRHSSTDPETELNPPKVMLNRQQAIDKKSASATEIYNRERRNGITRQQAWDKAAEELPDIEKIIMDVPPGGGFEQILEEGKIKNRLKAERDFATLSIAYQRRVGCTYEQARAVMRERESALWNRAAGADDAQSRDEAVITRAVEIVKQKSDVTLRAAITLANAELPGGAIEPGTKEYSAQAEIIGNRALEILRSNPTLRPHGAVKQASREIQATDAPIANRAQADADAITNRASEIQREMPGTPLASAYIMAENEIKGSGIGDSSIRNRRVPK